MRSTAALILAVLLLAGCGDPDEITGGETSGSAAPTVEEGVAASYPLPFGLQQLDGTEPIGRPIVYEDVSRVSDDGPIPFVTLHAAYRIPHDDPVEVFEKWVDQLATAELALDRLDVFPPSYVNDPWLRVSGSANFGLDTPPGDRADVELWATTGDPILLVTVQRRVDGDPPRTGTIEEHEAASPDPEPGETLVVGPQGHVVEETERAAGDPLFTEQGDTVHLPPGTRALAPTLPTTSGTGGSTSFLAAEDAEAAVRALLAEADGMSDYDEVTEPEVQTYDGAQIVTGRFVIPAGGWGFEVVAIRAPGDPWATVHVASTAD